MIDTCKVFIKLLNPPFQLNFIYSPYKYIRWIQILYNKKNVKLNNKRPVFFIGMQRSGTTVCVEAFSRHEELDLWRTLIIVKYILEYYITLPTSQCSINNYHSDCVM